MKMTCVKEYDYKENGWQLSLHGPLFMLSVDITIKKTRTFVDKYTIYLRGLS
jgi:hypothetical protein